MSSRASAVAERPVQQSEPPISKRAPQKRWSGSAVATLVTLFILTPLIGAGIALGVLAANGQFPAKTIVTNSTPAVPPQGTPGVQGTGQPGQGSGGLQSISSISSSKLHVSMKFPSDWTEDASHTSADSPYVVFRPPSQSGVVLVLQRFSSSTSAQINSTTDLNQGVLQANFQDPSVVQHVHNFRMVPAQNAQPTVGGVPWDEQDATFTNDFGVVIHVASLAVQHSQVYYNIIFTLPDASYSSLLQQSIQPMLDSLQFLA